jgi:acetyl-CoA carboxylase biotin carboxylase subunit
LSGIKETLSTANTLGYPVVVRISKGWAPNRAIHVCDDEQLKEAFLNAKCLSNTAVGKTYIYLEKYIEGAHHIEFQILADKYGSTIHLYERDCTVRRPYQKLIEEAPSPILSWELREIMGNAAVKIAKSLGYVNAGTVKFLLDENMNFYFKEVNPRIQVEHPVTEMVTDVDIIREQLLIASGERLDLRQKDVSVHGHAIECRVYAEDPENSFSPSVGIINDLFLPGGMGVRVDTHIYKGYNVSQYYDPLLAKLIIHGRDRKDALNKTHCCLEELTVSGIKTTNGLSKKIISDSDFIAGTYSNDLIEKIVDGGKPVLD